MATEATPPAGVLSRATAGLTAAWNLKHFVPVVTRTAASHYLYGPPHPSWTLRLSLFTALFRFNALHTASLRRSSGVEVDPVEHTRETRSQIEGLMGGKEKEGVTEQPGGGAVWVETVGVRRRGLGGVLREVDGEESGERAVKAEWTAHRSLLTSSSVSSTSDRVLLYLHGGAYTLLSPRTHRPLVVQLSKELGVRALSVDYRLSPETKFPGALLDAVNAYFYLTEDLGIPAANILVGGDSAGGNLCLALMLYLRDEKLPQVGGAVLISPWADMTGSLGSWDENKDFDYLSVQDDHLTPPRLFLPTGPSYSTLLLSPYVSPALTASFTSLPPLLIHSGALETLRDEHTLLALRAAAAGVDVAHEVFKESVHVFHAVQKETSAKAALRAVGDWGRGRAPVGALPQSEALQDVDERLREAWTSRPAEEQREKDASTALPPPQFAYTKVYERLPPIKLRPHASPEARRAVEEAEAYKAREKLTAVFYAKSTATAATGGYVGWLRGLVGL